MFEKREKTENDQIFIEYKYFRVFRLEYLSIGYAL